MRKSSWIPFVVIPLVIVLAIVGGRFLYFGADANAYVPPERGVAEVSLASAPLSARLNAVEDFTVGNGVVVIDYVHDNALYIEELNVLLSKVVARGFKYEVLAGITDEKDRVNALADKLRYAKALILPLPRTEYSADEIAEIERFVEKGGQVLIIGDPTRTISVEALNSIAGSFDIVYANDYLYSIENNDNNYRNVVYTKFAKSPLTKGLDEGSKVIFYAGGSVNAPGHEIILGDETTHSSVSEGGRTMASAVLTSNDQVLALGDLTFFSEPYSAAENNGIFINNIADFLTAGQRDFELKDFPYFLNDQVDIVFDDSLVLNSQFEDSVKLKEYLENLDRNVSLVDTIGDSGDVIFVGRFTDAEVVQKYLDAANISIIAPDEKVDTETQTVQISRTEANRTPAADGEERFIDGRIRIAGVGDLERGGSTLFYLDQENGRNILIILSDNPDTNADAFKLLFDNKLGECLARPNVAVCQTEDPNQKLPPSLRSDRIDKILVVSDDDGRVRNDEQTSVVAYNKVLSGTYSVDLWVTSDDGSPDIDQLLEYDAVIWTTGDYWDDSISEEDTAMLSKYIEVGGNLIMSGASIAFDWDHTDFMTAVAHADYLDFAEQKDIQLALPDHPIADGFENDVVIPFVDTPSGEKLEPDVVGQLADARVIFLRGPDSEQTGAASVIAYEDDRSKIAYFAFPVYMLPNDAQTLLINNTVDWFTKKPLPLPNADESTSVKKEAPADENGGSEDTGSGGGEDTGNGQDNGNQDQGDGSGNGNQSQ